MTTLTNGMTVIDTLTGFKGLITAMAYYISGCNQVLVQPKVKKDGGFEESIWIDEQRLKQVGKKIVTLNNEKNPGFDKEAPKR